MIKFWFNLPVFVKLVFILFIEEKILASGLKHLFKKNPEYDYAALCVFIFTLICLITAKGLFELGFKLI